MILFGQSRAPPLSPRLEVDLTRSPLFNSAGDGFKLVILDIESEKDARKVY